METLFIQNIVMQCSVIKYYYEVASHIIQEWLREYKNEITLDDP